MPILGADHGAASVSCSFGRHGMVLYGIVWCCMVLYGIVWSGGASNGPVSISVLDAADSSPEAFYFQDCSCNAFQFISGGVKVGWKCKSYAGTFLTLFDPSNVSTCKTGLHIKWGKTSDKLGIASQKFL